MRLLVLTTDTPHHAFFVRELTAVYPDLHVVCETTTPTAPFDVHHPFEERREGYERETWFGGRHVALPELAETSICENVNEPDVLARIAARRAEATVVFGTRKLSPPAMAAIGANAMNLHGGDPEYYRGLDTHLWAIYHNDYANLTTTLHVVNESLDDGAIVGMRGIRLHRGAKLHQLRGWNTECAVRLTLDALTELSQSGSVPRRAQRQAGRYYSFMPAVLKTVCVAKFERYCANLS